MVLKETNYELKVDSRYHFFKVKMNGENVGTLMFTNTLPLNKYLKVGENLIELEICIGLRNAYGPFYTKEQEDLCVGPDLVERVGKWVNGKSEDLRNNYYFVKNFI